MDTAFRLGLLLVALVSPRSSAAQSYRLSQDPIVDWVEDVDAFQVVRSRVVFDTLERKNRATDAGPTRIWSISADGGDRRLLHDVETSGEAVGSWKVSPDAEWVVYSVQYSSPPRLVAVSADGSRRHELVEPSLVENQLSAFTFSPDSARVVFTTRARGGGMGLFSVPLVTPGPLVTLTRTDDGEELGKTAISPDSSRVVYISDEKVRGYFEVYSVPIRGTTPPRPLSRVELHASVFGFQISRDGRGVVWTAYSGKGDGVVVLWAAPIDGNSTAKRLTDPGLESVSRFILAPDSEHALYRLEDPPGRLVSVSVRTGIAEVVVDVPHRLQIVRLSRDGTVVYFATGAGLFSSSTMGGAPIQLDSNPVGSFKLSPDERQVIFTRYPDLYSTPSDGSNPTPLLFASVPGLREYSVSPDSKHVFFTTSAFQLFAVPIDASAPPTPVSEPSTTVTPIPFEISYAGRRLIYRNGDNVPVLQLWSVDEQGRNRIRLNETLDRGLRGDVYEATLDPTGRSAFYVASLGATPGLGLRLELWRAPLDDPRMALRIGQYEGDPGYKVEVWPPVVSRDGRWVAHGFDPEYGEAEYFLRTAETGEILSSGHCIAPPVFSEDSRYCFINESLRLAIVDLSRGAKSRLDDKASVDPWPTLQTSPDGSHVVYLRSRNAQGHVPRDLWGTPLTMPYHPILLSGTMVANGTVGGSPNPRALQAFRLTHHNVVYVADAETRGVTELYSVPIDGSASTVKISAPMVAGGGITVLPNLGVPFLLSPDGRYAVYMAEQETDGVVELFRAEVSGAGPIVRLNGPLAAGGDVGGEFRPSLAGGSQSFQVSADGRHVLYMADAEFDRTTELFVVPMDASASARKLNAPLAGNEWVTDFANGERGFVYRVERAPIDERGLRLFSGSIGSSSVREIAADLDWVADDRTGLSAAGIALTQDSRQVLFHGRPGGGAVELFVAYLDGSKPVRDVSGALTPGGRLEGPDGKPRLLVTPDGARALYIASQEAQNSHALYATLLRKVPRQQ